MSFSVKDRMIIYVDLAFEMVVVKGVCFCVYLLGFKYLNCEYQYLAYDYYFLKMKSYYNSN